MTGRPGDKRKTISWNEANANMQRTPLFFFWLWSASAVLVLGPHEPAAGAAPSVFDTPITADNLDPEAFSQATVRRRNGRRRQGWAKARPLDARHGAGVGRRALRRVKGAGAALPAHRLQDGGPGRRRADARRRRPERAEGRRRPTPANSPTTPTGCRPSASKATGSAATRSVRTSTPSGCCRRGPRRSALRFTHTAAASDPSYRGWLGGAFVLATGAWRTSRRRRRPRPAPATRTPAASTTASTTAHGATWDNGPDGAAEVGVARSGRPG